MENNKNNKKFNETEVIKEFTENYKYGTDLFLVLETENIGQEYIMGLIRFFEKNDIVRERIDIFFECCECDIDRLFETVFFLKVSDVEKKDIIKNLDSHSPILFLEESLRLGKDSFLNDDTLSMCEKSFKERLKTQKR